MGGRGLDIAWDKLASGVAKVAVLVVSRGGAGFVVVVLSSNPVVCGISVSGGKSDGSGVVSGSSGSGVVSGSLGASVETSGSFTGSGFASDLISHSSVSIFSSQAVSYGSSHGRI